MTRGQKWDRQSIGATVLTVMAIWSAILPGLPAGAQEPDAFPPSPLEMTEPDPLLPQLVVDRPLSEQERRVLATALEELRVQAEAAYQSGDIIGAIDIWNRELRLRRVLGPQEEVASLSRVGDVAWRENQTTEVRVITERLQQIEQEAQAQTPVDYDLLLQIAQAYQTVRAIEPVTQLYQQIRLQAQQQQNIALEKTTLVNLGELYLAWFDYPNAAATYQELLAIARAEGDALGEAEYLRKVADIYQADRHYEQAIAFQQQLVSLYERQQEYAEIPPLKIAMGDNYLALSRPDLAAPSYQEAYAVARSTQQYGFAGDALQQLATLYRSINRPNDALVVYQLLIDVEQQSYNTLGIMETFDQIGQVHREMGNNAAAIAAFRQGLQLAQQLNYKVGYFNEQIAQLSQ